VSSPVGKKTCLNCGWSRINDGWQYDDNEIMRVCCFALPHVVQKMSIQLCSLWETSDKCGVRFDTPNDPLWFSLEGDK